MDKETQVQRGFAMMKLKKGGATKRFARKVIFTALHSLPLSYRLLLVIIPRTAFPLMHSTQKEPHQSPGIPSWDKIETIPRNGSCRTRFLQPRHPQDQEWHQLRC